MTHQRPTASCVLYCYCTLLASLQAPCIGQHNNPNKRSLLVSRNSVLSNMSSADDSKHKQSTTSTTTWLTLAAAVISDQREANTSTWSDASADDLLSVLKSFGAEDAPGPVTLDPCDGGTPADISNKIREVLVAEIDDDQAQMFARRFVSVSTLLMADGSEIDSMQDTGTKATVDVNALLRLALHRRAVQILSASDDRGPKALRIRALVDFVWSQSLVLGKGAEERGGCPSLIELVRSSGPAGDETASAYEEFAPGFRHATVAGQTSDFGPVHVNVLRIR